MSKSIKHLIEEINGIQKDMKVIMLVTEMVNLDRKIDRAEMADEIINLFTSNEEVSEE